MPLFAMERDTEIAGPDFKDVDDNVVSPNVDHVEDNDPDAEFGGREERRKMEKKLVRKLDARMCILIVIYILNYVSLLIKLSSEAFIYIPIQD